MRIAHEYGFIAKVFHLDRVGWCRRFSAFVSKPAEAANDALSIREAVELIRNTSPFNVYGLPTISIPCGFTRSGLPIGMQISGRLGGDAVVLQLAHAYEQATEWHKRRPLLK